MSSAGAAENFGEAPRRQAGFLLSKIVWEGSKLNIRHQYSSVVRALAERYPQQDSSYVISENTTLEECIGYTMKYIVDRGDYRYDRYKDLLRETYQRFRRAPGDTIFHIDVGCGPGLFSWVMADCFGRSESGLKLFGYDKSPNMVRLAQLIWSKFNINISSDYVNKTDDLYSQLHVHRPFGKSHIVISFGHVLIQAYEEDSDMRKIAHIVACICRICAPMHCHLLAVDARSGGRGSVFRSACESLRQALVRDGLSAIFEEVRLPSSIYGRVARP